MKLVPLEREAPSVEINYSEFININDGSRSLNDKGKLVLRAAHVFDELSRHYNPQIQYSANHSYLGRLLSQSKELKNELRENGISPNQVRKTIAPRVSELSRVPLWRTRDFYPPCNPSQEKFQPRTALPDEIPPVGPVMEHAETAA